MKIIFGLFLVTGILFANVPAPCKDQEPVLIANAIDLDTKTIKGWVRLLNNRSKQGKYGVHLTKEETMDLIKCLLEELRNRKEAGKMK